MPNHPTFKSVDHAEIRSVISVLQHQIRDFDRHTGGDEIHRICETVSRIPVATSSSDHLVDIGGTILWLPIYKQLLGYKQISLVQFPGYLSATQYDPNRLKREFNCQFVPANADKSTYEIASASATCALCFELLEHLQGDPMHLIGEANRMLAVGGYFYLTTPNVLYHQNLIRFLFGDHPFSWSVYTDGYGDRHNREYTALELTSVLQAGGFELTALETLTYSSRASALKLALAKMLCLLPAITGRVPMNMRGAFSHWRGQKVGDVRDRYPPFLYDLGAGEKVTDWVMSPNAEQADH